MSEDFNLLLMFFLLSNKIILYFLNIIFKKGIPMKKMFEQLIKIIENANGAREIIEAEFKKYYDINKQMIEESAKKMGEKMEEMKKNLPNPNDFTVLMGKMFEVMSDMVGEENFKKMMELQQKYPFLQEVSKKFMPGK